MYLLCARFIARESMGDVDGRGSNVHLPAGSTLAPASLFSDETREDILTSHSEAASPPRGGCINPRLIYSRPTATGFTALYGDVYNAGKFEAGEREHTDRERSPEITPQTIDTGEQESARL